MACAYLNRICRLRNDMHLHINESIFIIGSEYSSAWEVEISTSEITSFITAAYLSRASTIAAMLLAAAVDCVHEYTTDFSSLSMFCASVSTSYLLRFCTVYLEWCLHGFNVFGQCVL